MPEVLCEVQGNDKVAANNLKLHATSLTRCNLCADEKIEMLSAPFVHNYIKAISYYLKVQKQRYILSH